MSEIKNQICKVTKDNPFIIEKDIKRLQLWIEHNKGNAIRISYSKSDARKNRGFILDGIRANVFEIESVYLNKLFITVEEGEAEIKITTIKEVEDK